jgi:hypothetical protein
MYGDHRPEQNCLGDAVNKVTIRKEVVDELNDILMKNDANSWTEYVYVLIPHFRIYTYLK